MTTSRWRRRPVATSCRWPATTGRAKEAPVAPAPPPPPPPGQNLPPLTPSPPRTPTPVTVPPSLPTGLYILAGKPPSPDPKGRETPVTAAAAGARLEPGARPGGSHPGSPPGGCRGGTSVAVLYVLVTLSLVAWGLLFALATVKRKRRREAAGDVQAPARAGARGTPGGGLEGLSVKSPLNWANFPPNRANFPPNCPKWGRFPTKFSKFQIRFRFPLSASPKPEIWQFSPQIGQFPPQIGQFSNLLQDFRSRPRKSPKLGKFPPRLPPNWANFPPNGADSESALKFPPLSPQK